MKTLKGIVVFGLGLFSAMYLLNIGAGVIELIPGNIPILGNLDEAATALEQFNFCGSRGVAPVSGRVGVRPADSGVSPERTSKATRMAATQDASLGGQDAHPSRDSAPARNGCMFS